MRTNDPSESPLILLTGATGYVGGRLLQVLEQRGCRVRCLARRPDFLAPRVAASTEVVRGDVLDRESLQTALGGVDVAYYLVHSMVSKGSFEEDDRRAARNFAETAKAAGVERIIYLGGLGPDEEDLSPPPPKPPGGRPDLAPDTTLAPTDRRLNQPQSGALMAAASPPAPIKLIRPGRSGRDP